MDNKSNDFLKESYANILKEIFRRGGTSAPLDYVPQIDKYKRRSKLKTSAFFYDALAKKGEILKAHRRPLVGYFCGVVPEELILAAGGTPVRMDNADFSSFKVGEEIIPGDVCPLIKSICGAAGNDGFQELDLLVVPGTCDGKVKLAEVLSPQLADKLYFLDVPRETSYLKNVESCTERYEQFFEFLQERFKVKITRKELLSACEVTNGRTEVFRKIYEFRAQNPGIISAFDYYTICSASFFIHPSTWAEEAEKLYREALEAKEKAIAFEGRRVLLSGAPIIFPNFKVLDILESVGCDVACDTLCSTYGRMYDPVEIDEETEEGIIRALVLKYFAPSMCPCFIGMSKLLDFIGDAVEKYDLDGVIYYNLRLCQVFDIQTSLIRQVLKEKGIPFLSLKTELIKEDIGQLKTRAEAFLETLE